jgi:2-(1,2-epoxy-1,2-dihydrophenyl)acetyl-CoA isomerase
MLSSKSARLCFLGDRYADGSLTQVSGSVISPEVAFAADSAIAWITLNRPEAGNAINLEMAQSLARAAANCESDKRIRCVVLTGAGRMFCAGGDVKLFGAAAQRLPHVVTQLTDNVHAGCIVLAKLQKPLIILVNGPAAGAGFGLSMLGDIVIAARSAHFTVGYGAIGLTPDAGATWLLPRLVGIRMAQELIITNRRVTSQEAFDAGLVTSLVEDDQLAEAGSKMAAQLAESATAAIGASRALLLQSSVTSLESQLSTEARAIALAAASPESHEGIAAFLGKRKPLF